jgi:hypothetical protein
MNERGGARHFSIAVPRVMLAASCVLSRIASS